jgi:uncharacterized membrane protein YgcG
MAKQHQQQSRTFVKEVDGKTLTRSVTSPQAETAALFDGYAEEKPAKSSGGGSSGGRSGNAANTGGGSNAGAAS